MGNPLDNEEKSVWVACRSWIEVHAAVDLLLAETSGFSERTIENGRLFLGFGSNRYQVPNEVGLGYWPTFRLSWSSVSPAIEVEIFEDRYELYRFTEKTTEIRHVAVAPQGFPTGLRVLLDEAILAKSKVGSGI